MTILERIKYAEHVEATIHVIPITKWDIHEIETGIEITIDGETVTVDGADPIYSEVFHYISPNDVGYTRQFLCRQNLHEYCRLALTSPCIEKDWGMELVERAVRTVQNIEAREAKGA